MPDGTTATAQMPPIHDLDTLEAGALDKRGQTVSEVLWKTSDFVIYRAADGVFACFSGPPEREREQMRAYLSLGANLAEIEHLMSLMETDSHWKWSAVLRGLDPRTWFRGDRDAARIPARRTPARVAHDRELARCIAQALSGDVALAKAGLDALHARWAAQNRNRVRVVHLIVNIALTLATVGVALFFARSGYQSAFGFASKELAMVGMMGAVGALFSTTVRLQAMEVDATVRILVHIVYGLQRIMIGVLGAMILYFGLRSGILLELVRPGVTEAPQTGPTAEYELYWLSFICIVAGFSERLVPNLLNAQASAADPGRTQAPTV